MSSSFSRVVSRLSSLLVLQTKIASVSSKKQRWWLLGGGAAVLSVGIALGIRIHNNVLLLPSLTGTVILDDAYLKALVKAPVVQRLKNVDQSGPAAIFGFVPPFSRYDHSVGVWALLKKHRRSLPEQAAGLLHDASHTAFSHMADFLFSDTDYQTYTENGYQDTVHMRLLERQGVFFLAKRYQQDVQALNPETPTYLALEQPGPDLCADRIDYIVRTGLVMQVITKEEGKAILDDLHFDGKHWFFTTPVRAKQFAFLALYFTRHFWGAPWNVSLNIHFAKAVRRVIDLGELGQEDLQKDDAFVLERVQKCRTDPIVAQCWKQCQNEVAPMKDARYETVLFHPKFRGVDPFVKNEDHLIRLTDLDPMFKEAFEETKAWCKSGYNLSVLAS